MLTQLSNQMADAVAQAGSAVVQVQGHRRPASGVVYQDNIILTTTRALGREEGLRVRRPDGSALDAELVGWDPVSSLALLRADGLGLAPITPSSGTPRVGHLALALARSWSKLLRRAQASSRSSAARCERGDAARLPKSFARRRPCTEALPEARSWTSRAIRPGSRPPRRSRPGRGHPGIDRIEDGGRRARAWASEAGISRHRRPAGLPPGRPARRRGTSDSVAGRRCHQRQSRRGRRRARWRPTLAFDGKRVESPEDLLDLLVGDCVGRAVPLRILRGRDSVDFNVTVGERPAG